MTESMQDLTLEAMVTGHGLADLEASPLQLAICRAVDGRPVGDALDDDALEQHFGVRELPSLRPVIVALVCGVRSGKSFLAACKLIHAALTADLSRLKRHEVARGAVVAPSVDAAKATFTLLVGILRSSDVLAGFVEGEPTADSVTLRRPDGRCVELVVVAAHRGGLSVRNRWLVALILEEVAQFGVEATGAVVNAEELLRAAVTRLVPGGQVWLVSSPYGPVGLLHTTWREHFGRPGRVLVVHAPSRSMNPSVVTQAVYDAVAAESPDVAAREYGAEWLDADSAFLPAMLIDPATRDEPLVRRRPIGAACFAGMDPATRGNSWPLAVACRERVEGGGQRVSVLLARQWTGSKAVPLSPRAVFREVADLLRPYGVRRIHVDGWSFDALADHAQTVGLQLYQAPSTERDARYGKLKALAANGELELPPDPTLRTDLIALRQRATAGGVRIELPRTADGRHCDFAPAVALAVAQAAGTASRAAFVDAMREIQSNDAMAESLVGLGLSIWS